MGKHNFKNMELFTGKRTENQIPFFTHSFSVKLSKSLLIPISLLGEEDKEREGEEERYYGFSA